MAKIKYKQPMFWWVVELFFKADFKAVRAFTFGDTIYTPLKKIDVPLMAHEMVHVKQHHHSKLFACYVFVRYVLSKKYRLELEKPAFKAQVKAGLDVQFAARSLSGPFYGNLISYDEALFYLWKK